MISGVELIPRLRELYESIDQAYAAATAEVGFSCGGCDGVACCTVDVTLHTFAEMDYLRRGLSTLDEVRRNVVLDRCRFMVAAKRKDPVGESYRRSVCALNFEGLCGLYEYRPMICRLAGIPHFFVRPDGTSRQSGGCARYEREVLSSHPDIRIDRTPFYHAMAQIELDAVQTFGMRTTPHTVAETLAGAE